MSSLMLQQFNDLQECYLQKRRNWNKQGDSYAMDIEDYNPGLEDFHSVLKGFTQYRYKLLEVSVLSFSFSKPCPAIVTYTFCLVA